MLKNYFKIAWRNLFKNRSSSIINIGGLAVGMAVALLIGLWIHDEFAFNEYHSHYDQIGQVMIHNGHDIDGTYGFLPIPVAKELRSSFADDFAHVALSTTREEHILSSGDKKFTIGGSYMQPEAPEMLTLKMLSGTRSGLGGIHSILLGASMAKKLFGAADPMDQIIKIDDSAAVSVTGVYEDLPDNSSFKGIDFIAPWDLLVATNDLVRGDQDDWNDNSFLIYVQLAPLADFARVSARIKDIELRHGNKDRAALDPALFVHPMSKWHLYSHFENRVIVTSEQLKLVWFYLLIGVFILLLACINFMNLSTARSEKRAREVGIRKTIGSARFPLIVQFFSESILTALLSFALCILLLRLILPWFDEVAGKALTLPWGSPAFWVAGLVFTIITGVLAGSYPALYLSSFRPIKVLKGSIRLGRLAAVPRKVLVVFQFTVSIALIIGTLVVYRQIQFAKDRPVGYSREGLIQIRMVSPEFQGKYDLLTDELKKTGVVTQMAESSASVTGNRSNTGGIDWKGKDPNLKSDFSIVRVSPEYGRTIGFQLVEGRDFSRDYATDSVGFIINEAAAKYMGLSHPVGEIVKWDNKYEKINENFHIVGVVKDMVMNSPFEKVKQTLFRLRSHPNWISIKINPNASLSNALPKIEAVFKKLIPGAPFEYTFVDDAYAAKFKAEQRIGALSYFFAVLAILISCLGLFGLASYVAEQRTKEIGVRKVLGATVFGLWCLLSTDFVMLVLLSMLIAGPIAWYFMHRWLAQYEYRERISWWIFAAAGMGAMAVTLLTISIQVIKAAIANPMRSLRTE